MEGLFGWETHDTKRIPDILVVVHSLVVGVNFSFLEVWGHFHPLRWALVSFSLGFFNVFAFFSFFLARPGVLWGIGGYWKKRSTASIVM